MQPEIEVVHVDQLGQASRLEIIELCSVAFDEDFQQLFQLLQGSTHVLAYVAGDLVSHACWITRWLQPGELRPLHTAYVEAVATLPRCHGQGYGSMVMRRVTTEIAGYELGGLSPARSSFYQRLGWEMWRGPTAIRTAQGLLATPGEEVMILRTPRTPALDLDALLTAEWREGELW